MVPNGFQHVTGLGNFPLDWLVASADEVTEKITKGTTPPKSEIVEDSNIPFLRVNNLGFHGSLNSKSEMLFVTENSHHGFLSRSVAYPNDILMNIVGPPLGKIAMLDNQYPEYNMNQAVLIYRCKPQQIDNRYFLSFLQSELAQQWLQSRSKKTSGQQNLTIQICKELPTPVPRLQEQRKIAQILSTWDRGIAITEKLIDASKQQKKALMQQLLTGKKRLVDPETGKAFEEEWVQVSFGDIAKVSSKKYDPNKTEISFPCIELEHIDQASGVILGTVESKQLASIKSIFQSGDVLFGKLRPYLKKYAYPKFSGVCSTEIWVLKANESVSSEYLYQFIQTNIFISEANKSTGSKMPRADWGVVSELVLKIPCQQEQQKIASVLTAADKEIELLQAKLAHFKQEKKALMQQLLTGKRRVSLSS